MSAKSFSSSVQSWSVRPAGGVLAWAAASRFFGAKRDETPSRPANGAEVIERDGPPAIEVGRSGLGRAGIACPDDAHAHAWQGFHAPPPGRRPCLISAEIRRASGGGLKGRGEGARQAQERTVHIERRELLALGIDLRHALQSGEEAHQRGLRFEEDRRALPRGPAVRSAQTGAYRRDPVRHGGAGLGLPGHRRPIVDRPEIAASPSGIASATRTRPTRPRTLPSAEGRARD